MISCSPLVHLYPMHACFERKRLIRVQPRIRMSGRISRRIELVHLPKYSLHLPLSAYTFTSAFERRQQRKKAANNKATVAVMPSPSLSSSASPSSSPASSSPASVAALVSAWTVRSLSLWVTLTAQQIQRYVRAHAGAHPYMHIYGKEEDSASNASTEICIYTAYSARCMRRTPFPGQGRYRYPACGFEEGREGGDGTDRRGRQGGRRGRRRGGGGGRGARS